ncbi:tail fiber domain-containing protein [Flavobacterium sp. F372]|uniref:Tail fiber domain-containing protein n=1 Tax=Flavobacterium bernardetii TaxID=2813823 RepID=A0ABR7IY46_9FLAO|nr:tail fiber domain-containing protein [Flavobacterium bernardetii]MBC5834699.1 tail fiber domain-containing protein [Flavobacterium bernardetii]NHF70347.1 tail fiber domain-containing protein [Flavobacterium bernardetii]
MKKYLQLLVILLVNLPLFAQVGIGTTSPNTSAALDIVSSTKGVLIPRMTLAQRGSIPVGATQNGLLIYQTDASPGFYYYNGTAWATFGSGSSWGLTGNASTTPAANKLGTTDGQDFVIKTNNTEAMRITAGGNIGIGTITPSTLFHLKDLTGSGGTLFSQDFESVPLGNVSLVTTNNPYSKENIVCVNKWKIQNTDNANATCATKCTNRRATIDYGSSECANQNATLVLKIGVINVASMNVSFDYNYNWYDGGESFQVDLYNETTSSVASTLLGPLTSDSGEVNFSQSVTGYTVGNSYSLRFTYIATDDMGASLDNVVVTSPPTLFRINDGTQANGYALTSDTNGVATWKPAGVGGSDDDWAFTSGITNSDPIYHQGYVKVGTPTASTHNLHVYNGATSGTVLSLGSVEYIRDGVADWGFGYPLVPLTTGVQNLGSPTNRWVTVWTSLVSRLADVTKMTEIQPLPYGIDQIMKLNPITYKWKKERLDDFIIPEEEKSPKIGFSAQELLLVLPEVVETYQWKEREENPGILVKEVGERLAVNYSEIIPVIVKAIQEQEAKIKELEITNEKLKQLITKY